jgi:hypothetical protein
LGHPFTSSSSRIVPSIGIASPLKQTGSRIFLDPALRLVYASTPSLDPGD